MQSTSELTTRLSDVLETNRPALADLVPEVHQLSDNLLRSPGQLDTTFKQFPDAFRRLQQSRQLRVVAADLAVQGHDHVQRPRQPDHLLNALDSTTDKNQNPGGEVPETMSESRQPARPQKSPKHAPMHKHSSNDAAVIAAGACGWA